MCVVRTVDVLVLLAAHPALAPLAVVRAQVPLHVAGVGEALVADGAGVGLVPGVRAHVQLQVGGPAEALVAHVALDRLQVEVNPSVAVEHGLLLEAPPTHAAGEQHVLVVVGDVQTQQAQDGENTCRMLHTLNRENKNH